MKRILTALAAATILSTAAHAENIGVTMAAFDDNFLTLLRNSMQDHAKASGAQLQVEDATQDVGKQQSQIQNFIASGLKVIIVNPVDSDATAALSKLARDAGVALVFINRQPSNVESLPDNQVYVGSDEAQSGTLETQEVCRQLKAAGKKEANVVVMMGELQTQAARVRTKDVHDVVATPECSFIKIVDEQTANFQRTQGADLVSNWLSAGLKFDAVIANNDEMAIGASQALKAAGTKDVLIAGIDATSDALAAMKAGDLHVTVFQNAKAQGESAVDSALKLAKGEKIADKKIFVPFELVTKDNLAKYSK